MSTSRTKPARRGVIGLTAVSLCIAAAGIAFGGTALGESSGSTAGIPKERSELVAVPELGIAVPARTTELVDVARAVRLIAATEGQWVFRAPGLGEFEGDVCIFAAHAVGPTDVVPVVCDTPEAARRGLDLGQSTPDGGVSGVVVRDGADGTTAAEAYSVGAEGGTVAVRPGGGPSLTLTFPNFKQLDAHADQDARAYAASQAARP